jgi:hypothetical protein
MGFVLSGSLAGFLKKPVSRQERILVLNTFSKSNTNIFNILLRSKQNNPIRNCRHHKRWRVNHLLKKQNLKIQQTNCIARLIFFVDPYKVRTEVNSYFFYFISSVFRPPHF